MRGAWISIVALATGCDVVYGLTGRHDGAVDTVSGDGAVDAMPEQCVFGPAQPVLFAGNLQPLHDFVDDGAGRGFVSAFVTEGATQSRSTAVLDDGGIWIHDLSPRDGVGGFTGVRPEVDPMEMYGLVNLSTSNQLARWRLEGGIWTTVDMRAIDNIERVGNYRVLDGKRVYVMTQKPVPLDVRTRMVLRVRDGESWNEEDRMTAINTTMIPDLGVLTRDGLTLIYSAKRIGELQFDLYISTRDSLTANFPIGTPIAEVSSPEDEVEPWIFGACDRLYFRRGRTFFDGAGQVSTIHVATRPTD